MLGSFNGGGSGRQPLHLLLLVTGVGRKKGRGLPGSPGGKGLDL